MSQQPAAAQFYTCPMHPDIRRQGPGTCPKCKMELVPEGTRFGIIRHMISNPLHLLVMAVLMIGVMAVAMMLMR